jgi:hypothetical protein
MRALSSGSLTVLLSAACCLWKGASAGAADGNAALAAHQSSVESVQTIHLKFQVVRTKGVERSEVTGEFWRAPSAQRIKTTVDGVQDDIVLTTDKVTVVTRQKSRKTGASQCAASILPNAGFIPLQCMPWRDALFAFDTPNGLQSLPVLLEQDKKATIATTRGEVVVTASDGRSLTLDPRHNYLVKMSKFEFTMEPPTGAKLLRTSRMTVMSFVEVGPGVYFPFQVKHDDEVNGEVKGSRLTSFHIVSVNKPIPRDVFAIRYDDRTVVSDKIAGTEYEVNANGEVSRPPKPLVAPSPGPGPSDAVAQYAGPTVREPRRWGWWILPAALSLMFVALAIRFARRARSLRS